MWVSSIVSLFAYHDATAAALVMTYESRGSRRLQSIERLKLLVPHDCPDEGMCNRCKQHSIHLESPNWRHGWGMPQGYLEGMQLKPSANRLGHIDIGKGGKLLMKCYTSSVLAFIRDICFGICEIHRAVGLVKQLPCLLSKMTCIAFCRLPG